MIAWRRGPRQSEELAAQEALFPASVVVRTITRPERHAVVVENWLAKVRASP